MYLSAIAGFGPGMCCCTPLRIFNQHACGHRYHIEDSDHDIAIAHGEEHHHHHYDAVTNPKSSDVCHEDSETPCNSKDSPCCPCNDQQVIQAALIGTGISAEAIKQFTVQNLLQGWADIQSTVAPTSLAIDFSIYGQFGSLKWSLFETGRDILRAYQNFRC